MDMHVNSSAPQYFRCHRLVATITPRQCRINRERCDAVLRQIDLLHPGLEEVRAPCLHCPQAAQVDACRVRLFTIRQVIAGRAMREPAAQALPDEVRFSAAPYEHSDDVFTSHYWVPECDL